jgi:formylglycine-generating enzyme required for sulfatase activity
MIAIAGVISFGLIAIVLIWFIFNAINNRGDDQSVAEPILPTSTQKMEQGSVNELTTPEPENTPTIMIPTDTPMLTEAATSTPVPTLGIGATLISPIDGSVMVFVPEGEFIMGSDPDEPYFWGAEAPSHAVYLDAFWIHRTEVTNSMYGDCVAAGACPSPLHSYSRTHDNYYNNPDFADYPVIYVTNTGALAYCQWIGARLPTEAEWEKAARGTDGRFFPWGNGSLNSNLANFCDIGCPNAYPEEIESEFNDGYRDVAPVGSFPDGVSPYGVLDMAGNVLEWVSDWYSPSFYGQSPFENPTGPESGTKHPIRGGSWLSGRAGLRTSARASLQPDNGYDTLGFRCALTPSE